MTGTEQNQRLAMRVSLWSIAGNLALTALKLAAGVLAHSSAMISDAAHSASDIASTLVVIWGLKVSARREDAEHPYGHERMECVASVALAGLLFLTGLSIGAGAVRAMIGGLGGFLPAPGRLALAAAAVSIAAKELMYCLTLAAAKRTGSTSLMADAWHHRSDAASSVGSLIGIAGARLGAPILDPAAGLLISLLIVKVALSIARQAFDQMLDRACDPAVQRRMEAVVREQEGVRALDRLTTRQFGPRLYVDVWIAADGRLTIEQGHEIAHRVHRAIDREFPSVKHCMVHVNPYRGD